MQLSISPKFPGYRPEAWEYDITIWLDGIQQHKVVAFDTEAGTVTVQHKDYGFIEAKGAVEIRNDKGKRIAWTKK